MTRTPIRLDIFSDPVCPWCYIGKANLDRALAAHSDHPFRIEWHPFQLNPEMPRAGMDRAAYLEAKFGGRENAARAYSQVEAAAARAGITLSVASVPYASNTLDAHRLIHWAGIEGLQDAVVDALFRAYWHEARNIGDIETLADIAGENGMDRVATLRLLRSDADADDIRARDEDARRKGVTAVPTFLIAQQYVVSGAQPTETWDKVIAELSGRAA
ncbi:MAG: DsbA family oxidoreductase [Tabrizicola sp.]|jgi:predicted DsbA family dithiol-disulfide isomerase|nr:DsbA family oxidoreductase [Tabrizicola sp.]